VIESVLQARIEAGQTWDQVKLTSSTRTVRRWVAAFLARTPVWFLLLLSTLAQTQPELEIFDPHGVSGMPDQARALLALSRVFAHWLDPGHADPLRRLWRWGWNAGVGRLV
jgi:hypothetical protein